MTTDDWDAEGHDWVDRVNDALDRPRPDLPAKASDVPPDPDANRAGDLLNQYRVSLTRSGLRGGYLAHDADCGMVLTDVLLDTGYDTALSVLVRAVEVHEWEAHHRVVTFLLPPF